MSENDGSLPRFIVMNIVFKGRSLNYDQGAGNYQELKKITKFDGKQYSMISRYALRYSILETGKRLGYWDLYTGFTKENVGTKGSVLQPAVDDVLAGGILQYPEFDLFGFMVTTGQGESNLFRESPVKISHAISLTPFNFDAHMSGNHGLVKRAIQGGHLNKIDINLFTREEHEAYYGYTVVVDTERIGKIELYLPEKEWKKKEKENIQNRKWEKITDNKYKLKTVGLDVTISAEKLEGPKDMYRVIYEISQTEKQKRIENLIKAIIHATRSIKGSSSSLSPHILVLGLYNDGAYDTYLDRISLKYQYEQIKETTRELIDKNDPSKGEKIIERITVTRVPKFVIYGVKKRRKVSNATDLEEEVINAIMGEKENSSPTVYHLKELEIELPDKSSDGEEEQQQH